MEMPALLGLQPLQPFHNTHYASMIINVLDRRWSKILAQAQCSDHEVAATFKIMVRKVASKGALA